MISTVFHSHKGGVGKTTLCVNLAFHLAKNGYSVAVIDSDYTGPNLYTFFDQKPTSYINDYLDENAKPEEILLDVSDYYDLEGKLWIGLADPTSEATKANMRVNQEYATKALRKELRLKAVLSEKPYNIDYLIYDTSPGINMNSINTFLLADNIVFLIKMSNSDFEGTGYMINALLESLNRVLILANQIPEERISNETKRKRLGDLIQNNFVEAVNGKTNIEFIGWIPTDPDLQLREFDSAVMELEGETSKRMIHTIQLADHPFSLAIASLSGKLDPN